MMDRRGRGGAFRIHAIVTGVVDVIHHRRVVGWNMLKCMRKRQSPPKYPTVRGEIHDIFLPMSPDSIRKFPIAKPSTPGPVRWIVQGKLPVMNERCQVFC